MHSSLVFASGVARFFLLLAVIPASGLAAPTAMSSGPSTDGNPCGECLVGPVELAIQKGAPRTFNTKFEADPQDDYTLVVEKLGEPEAAALVQLNGRILVHFENALSLGEPLYVPVSLRSVNLFHVVIRGLKEGRIRVVLVRTASLPPSRQACGARTDFFTHYPADLGLISNVLPLGQLSPPPHTLPTHHFYLNTFLVTPGDPDTATIIDVFAPGRVEIVAVVRNSAEDFQIHMQPCREVRTYFEVRTLDRFIEDRLRPDAWVCFGDSPDASCAQRTSIVVEGGQRLANAPVAGSINLAWGLIDRRLPPLPFANPSRYDLSSLDLSSFPPEVVALVPYVAPERLQQFCPADYFVPGLRAPFLALTGRVVAPICGEHEQDEPGTAQGGWFFGPDASAIDENRTTLSLVHDNVDPSVPVFSVSRVFCAPLPGGGESCAWVPGRHVFTPAAAGLVNRDFDGVAPDAIYCYENLTNVTSPGPDSEVGRVLVEVFASASGGMADRLRIEPVARAVAASCGPGPWSFGGGVREFQR